MIFVKAHIYSKETMTLIRHVIMYPTRKDGKEIDISEQSYHILYIIIIDVSAHLKTRRNKVVRT